MTSISDARERERALDPSRSYIVQAPAGSGKTELLTQRYLKLLAFVDSPEQILAMTFTRKAAGEMKDRILNALANGMKDTPPESGHEKRAWQLARNALERDRKKQWRIFDNPSRLQIRTIDSYCRGLAAQMPLLSGLGDPPATEENTWEIYRETARRALQLVEDKGPMGEVVRSLLSHLDNSRSFLQKGIIDLLGKRAQWLTDFFKQLTLDEAAKVKLEKVLSDLIESKLDIACKFFPQATANDLPALASFSAENLANENQEHDNACLLGLSALPPPTAGNLKQWKALAWLLTTENGNYRKPGGVSKRIGFPSEKSEPAQTMKQSFQALLESLQDKEELRQALQEVKILPHPCFSDSEWSNLKALIILLSTLAKILRGVFGERGKTDFTEITLSALDALGEAEDPSELLLKLDMKLQHILVDEYQDTSFKQHQLLEKLTYGWTGEDGRSLFIVGDPMQSIYRFRDAEVRWFLNARDEGIGDGDNKIHLQALTLKTNFRSQKKIVDWVNECFGKIFPRLDNPLLGAIKHTSSQADRPDDPLLEGVVLHQVEEPKTTEEADAVIKLIREIRENYPTESIAILARTKLHLRNIIHALQGNDIPFQAEDIYSLDTRPAILDLAALLRSLFFPQDRLSWLAILRAPWCGLSLADLHQLCHDDTSSPIWDLLNEANRVARLSADGQTRVSQLVCVMDNALRSRFTASPRNLVEGCWIALGGSACVNETELKDTQVFFDKIAEIVDEGDINRLQYFEQSLKTIFSAGETGESNPVHIMTMHKAKGLEFDFVILPGLGKQPKTEEKRLLLWLSHGKIPLIAPIQERGGEKSELYDFLAAQNKTRETLETFRLLYVAATRAKKQLHLFGHVPDKKDARAPKPNSLLGKLWPYLQQKWPPSMEKKQETTEHTENPEKTAPTIKRLPSGFPTITMKKIPPDIETKSLTEITGGEPEFTWAGNQARCLGTVLHAMFQRLAESDDWEWANVKKLRPALESALMGQGLPYDQLENTLTKGMQAIENIRQDETGRWILKKHTQHESELPLTGRLGDSYENRIIDRTFIDENDVRWIIDYKTGEHQGADLEVFFAEEKERYRRQLDEYEELIRLNGETRRIKKALYYPMQKQLIEIS